MIAERCTTAFTVPVSVTLKAVRFLPRDCICTSDEGCAGSPDRTQCLPGLFQSALCPAGAASCGACVTSKDKCPHDGEPCQLVGGTCAGTIRCLNGETTCVLRDPSCLE